MWMARFVPVSSYRSSERKAKKGADKSRLGARELRSLSSFARHLFKLLLAQGLADQVSLFSGSGIGRSRF